MSDVKLTVAYQPTVRLSSPELDHAPMKRALVLLCAFYGATIVTLYWVGIQPVVPWPLLPVFVLVVIPFALGAAGAVSLVARHVTCRHAMTRGRCVLLGAIFLAAYRLDSPLFLLGQVVLLPVVARSVWRSGLVRPLTLMAVALTVGYATIWNLNYLVALLSKGRLADPVLRELDIALYQLIFRIPVDYLGFFPIVRSEVLFRLFENAYVMLLPEIFVVALLWVMVKRDVAAFLRTFFLCYLVGLIVFALYPAVGPCIAFPDSFGDEFRETLTFRLMDGMASEYTASLERTSVNGFGYFIAIPSLHVALAVVLQVMLRVSPAHFWAFLPINVVVASSTIILGYHYLIDMLAGLALGASVALPYWRRTQVRHKVQGSEHATSSPARERSARE